MLKLNDRYKSTLNYICFIKIKQKSTTFQQKKHNKTTNQHPTKTSLFHQKKIVQPRRSALAKAQRLGTRSTDKD
ncbi:hypothetical protein HanIR_Chr17g0883711 [Helianthus annuus]|nr:hypothetical protein HanIR_Chr17g0883711 [Helianthus annuus]